MLPVGVNVQPPLFSLPLPVAIVKFKKSHQNNYESKNFFRRHGHILR